MKIISKYLFIAALFAFLPDLTNAQTIQSTKIQIDSFKINFQNTYQLNTYAMVPFTEQVKLHGKTLNPRDYTINLNDFSLKLADSLEYSIFDTLVVIYTSYDLGIKRSYQKRTLNKVLDYAFSKDSVSIFRNVGSPLLSNESLFGKGIQSSGAIYRGFSFGTNKDMQLNSGLRLELNGKISEDIEITAALTDEKTPIQPEGNTETLQEFDKIFIEAKHPNGILTFGDYDFDVKNGNFGSISRKLQGFKTEYFDNNMRIGFAYATQKGKFNSTSFMGSDGVQGPYRLYGQNGEKDIIIIAGSETVYLDGSKLKRGDGNDYIIDYSNAQITFTTKRLITVASKIAIDFQYSTYKYQRNFLGVTGQSDYLGKSMKLSFSYFRETDDYKAPIDFSLTDSDKQILKQAGNDRSKAVKSGVNLVAVDSNGVRKGYYAEIDTLINGNPYKIYRYLPGSEQAIYSVSFSYMGSGKGDYIKQSLGVYEFTGPGSGDYMPVTFLAVPEEINVGTITLSGEISKWFDYSAEFSGSYYDANRLSNLDDSKNLGGAGTVSMNFKNLDLNFAGNSYGILNVNLKSRMIDDKYSPMSRLNASGFQYDYNLLANDANNKEFLNEIGMNYSYQKYIKSNFNYGSMSYGTANKSDRYSGGLTLEYNKYINSDYKFDYALSENSTLKSYWNRHYYTIKSEIIEGIEKGINLQYEDKTDKNKSTWQLISGSQRNTQYAPFISFKFVKNLTISGEYCIRNDQSLLNGAFADQSKTITQKYDANYSVQNFSNSLNFTFSNKKYEEPFRLLGEQNSETVLMRDYTRYSLFSSFLNHDIYYEVSTQKNPKYEKVFVKVTKGTGSYIYQGDLNNNGIQDEEEFKPTLYDGEYILTTVPTDKLYPVIDLKASTRIKFKFSNLIGKNDGITGTLLNPLSTETYVRIEENSQDKEIEKIYLLDFNRFMNETNTLKGAQIFQQDFFLWENSQELSFRFRYFDRNNLSQYSSGLEKGYYNEKSVRANWQLIDEITNQSEVILSKDDYDAPANLSKSRRVTSSSFSTEFTYRPINVLEVAFSIKTEKMNDDYGTKPYELNTNSQTIKMNYSFIGSGKVRLEFERAELAINNKDATVPYELLKGNEIGNNMFIRCFLDLKAMENLQITGSYDGRKQGKGNFVQTFTMEARAYF